jgi:predicted metal-dependent enzyme (double-stranded beta helix superfamily)
MTRTTPPTALRHLIDRIQASVAEPAAVAVALRASLGDPTLLAPVHRRASADRYRTNLVHVAPDGSFSLVALVWRPGQRTPIHSHQSWCVVGVHEGLEEERSFSRVDRDGQPALALDEVHRFGTGRVTWAAAEDDIHDVANIGTTTAISLHVYGLDYRQLGSSILETFDLPIVEPEVVRGVA